jgi:hypothetical protein
MPSRIRPPCHNQGHGHLGRDGGREPVQPARSTRAVALQLLSPDGTAEQAAVSRQRKAPLSNQTPCSRQPKKKLPPPWSQASWGRRPPRRRGQRLPARTEEEEERGTKLLTSPAWPAGGDKAHRTNDDRQFPRHHGRPSRQRLLFARSEEGS